MEKLANVANEMIELWADELKFSNGLARTFFAETVYHALRIAYRWGARSEARKRKASASARYQKRLTKRAPDAPPESCEHGNLRGKCPVEVCVFSKHGGRR